MVNGAARQQVQDPPGRSDPDRRRRMIVLETRGACAAVAAAPLPPPRAPRRAAAIAAPSQPRRSASNPLRRQRRPRRRRIRSPARNPFGGGSCGEPVRRAPNPFAFAAAAPSRRVATPSTTSVRTTPPEGTLHVLADQERPRREPGRGRGRARCGRRGHGPVGHERAPRRAPRRRRARSTSARKQGKNFACDYFIPSEKLGTTRAPDRPARDRGASLRASCRARRAPSRSRARPKMHARRMLDLERPRAAVRRALAARTRSRSRPAPRRAWSSSGPRVPGRRRCNAGKPLPHGRLRRARCQRVPLHRSLVPRCTSASSRRWRSSCRRMGVDGRAKRSRPRSAVL